MEGCAEVCQRLSHHVDRGSTIYVLVRLPLVELIVEKRTAVYKATKKNVYTTRRRENQVRDETLCSSEMERLIHYSRKN